MNQSPKDCRPYCQWRVRTRYLELGSRTLIMGVVNITPDSFSDGGQFFGKDEAVAHALELLDQGADILDLGAESTRPGSRAGDPASAAVSAEAEQERLLPVLRGILKARPQAVISVDTYKASTARAAIRAGAEIVNDVSGFNWDPTMAATCSELGCGVVLMHSRGYPDEWRTQEPLASGTVLREVRAGLINSLRDALAAGISEQSIVLDPGYGFGKRFGENFELLGHQEKLLDLGRPLLVGLSRKSFLAKALNERSSDSPEKSAQASRETASVAALVTAILNGASIVRTHTVRTAVDAATIADAVLRKTRNLGGGDRRA